ncbi:MAG: hypothetical protein JWR52_1152 [Marmoricola sp.]|nr:hypothetical protein [Marmoricola sp.]
MSSSTSYEIPPKLAYGLVEGPRALSELGLFYALRPWLASHSVEEGRPVLVIPGLKAADYTTYPLRRLLSRVGHTPYRWGLGTNIGPTSKAIEGLDALSEMICHEHDAPISIIGQSLGGYLGAELARRHPDRIDRLITLAGPMAIRSLKQSRAEATYAKLRRLHLPEYEFVLWRTATRPEIPSTSIFSRSDGIVHWRACMYPDGALVENVEVRSSHLGMGVNPAAVYAVLDRLATSTENWSKFVPPENLRSYFPESTSEHLFDQG